MQNFLWVNDSCAAQRIPIQCPFQLKWCRTLLKTSTDTRRLSASSDASDVDLSNAGGLPHEFRPLKELPQYLKSVSPNFGH